VREGGEMIRDYISNEIQEVKDTIKALRDEEQKLVQARSVRNPKERKKIADPAKNAAKNKLNDLLDAASFPAAIYHFLAATQASDPEIDSATLFRTLWQEDFLRGNQDIWSRKNITDYEKLLSPPDVELALLPRYSFVIRFTFILAQSYISRDEQDFYIIDNPVRKDKVFGLPYVASTSWKGSLHAALWQKKNVLKDKNFNVNDKSIYRLFGNEKGEEIQENFHAGHLYFFPTFFKHQSLEIINPQNREKRSGRNPIPFESVPVAIRDEERNIKFTTGVFTLLYIPFDCIGRNDSEIRRQVAEDLDHVAHGLQTMFRETGFGAKTRSGFGLAGETLQDVSLEIQAPGIQKDSKLPGSFGDLTVAMGRLAEQLRSN
jgi:CRISPR-associated protein Cmr2